MSTFQLDLCLPHKLKYYSSHINANLTSKYTSIQEDFLCIRLPNGATIL